MSPPAGDEPDLELVAAALRVDTADVTTFARVVTGTLADALPEGMVEVVRSRSLGDRVRGREGRAEAVVVRTGEHVLTLRQGHGPVEAEDAVVVRGVVISRRQIGVEEWVRLLAEQVAARARESAAARTALQRLLGG
ncbi:hypothetical protein EV189_1373 [Motilibacter rhizosphaerae]|uniref:Uncharacterized protein n=1 Tax=Motilibacter rhizosphaerae TaxID=598652 RepID=A0A4Q7NRJ5_9ACTN|nr:hypothetical protein [Motilibacter rhizosphaerae]RZS89605.1 hypothetical protein EV189_1373 [Motilibacter rhizosphaerae]